MQMATNLDIPILIYTNHAQLPIQITILKNISIYQSILIFAMQKNNQTLSSFGWFTFDEHMAALNGQ